MGFDMNSKPTKWPTEVECGINGCVETAYIVQDQGGGYVDYRCEIHGDFAIQYEDSDEDFEEDSFSDEYDPWEIDYEWIGDEDFDDDELAE